MSIKVLPSQQVTGLQTETQFCLTALLWIMDTVTFPDPFTVADVKAALDAGQPAPFNTANFDQYLSNIYNLDLDTSLLTLSERSRLNIIFEYLQPSPESFCGGASLPTALNTSMANYERIGTATFENELQVLFDYEVDSAVFQVKITAVTPNGGAPAIAGALPINLFFKECDSNISKRVFTKIWIDFASTPVGVGFNYDFTLNIVDSSASTIATFPITGYVFT